MNNSKLFTFLCRLSSKRRERFLDFLNSPNFNRREAPGRLAQVVHENLDQQPEAPLSDEETYALVWPDKDFNLNQFRKLRSATLELLLQFLALEDWKNDQVSQRYHLIKNLQKIPDSPFFESYHQKAKGLVAPDTIDGLLIQYQLENEKYKFELKQGRSSSPTLTDAQKALELWTACEQLRIAYLQLNQARITGTQANLSPLLDPALEQLNSNVEQLPKEALGYLLLFQCSTASLPDLPYQHLRTFLHELPQKEQWSQDLFYGTLNFCYKRLNEGQTDYLREIRSWYNVMLVEGMLLENNQLEPAQLKNAVVIGIRLGEYNWAEKLIAQHAPPGLAATFCRGLIAYEQQDHPTAQKHFHKVLADPVDLFFGLDSRVYLLRSYFETKDTRALESYGNAFRVFLQRHPSLNSRRRKRYQSFVRLLHKLHTTPAHKTHQRDRLRNEVEAIDGFPVKAWFLKQV